MIEKSLIQGISIEGEKVYGYINPSESETSLYAVEEFNERVGNVQIDPDSAAMFAGVTDEKGYMLFEGQKILIQLERFTVAGDEERKALDSRTYQGVILFHKGSLIVKPAKDEDRNISSIYLYGMVGAPREGESCAIINETLEHKSRWQDNEILISAYSYIGVEDESCRRLGVLTDQQRNNIKQAIEIVRDELQQKIEGGGYGEIDRLLGDYRASISALGIPQGLLKEKKKSSLMRSGLIKEELAWLEKTKEKDAEFLATMKSILSYRDKLKQFMYDHEGWKDRVAKAAKDGVI